MSPQHKYSKESQAEAQFMSSPMENYSQHYNHYAHNQLKKKIYYNHFIFLQFFLQTVTKAIKCYHRDTVLL